MYSIVSDSIGCSSSETFLAAAKAGINTAAPTDGFKVSTKDIFLASSLF